MFLHGRLVTHILLDSGFVFGLLVTWLLARAGQVAPQELERSIA